MNMFNDCNLPASILGPIAFLQNIQAMANKRQPTTLEELVKIGALTQEQADECKLKDPVDQKYSIKVSEYLRLTGENIISVDLDEAVWAEVITEKERYWMRRRNEELRMTTNEYKERFKEYHERLEKFKK